jgi:hypothetical protein
MAQSIAKAAPANKRRECRAGFFSFAFFIMSFTSFLVFSSRRFGSMAGGSAGCLAPPQEDRNLLQPNRRSQ